MISSQRNMSLNNPVFKKFNSKDISRDSDSNIDDIDFQNVSIKPSYIELLNNRD